MERLLLDAQTVQNFSFHESVGVSGLLPTAAAALAVAMSAACVVEGISDGADSGGGGGGGGGF
jgi:hypothetical protein